MTNPFAPPSPLAAPDRPARRREDLLRFAAVVVGCVLLGAPAGLLWSAVAPHYRVERTKGELTLPNIESTKAFIGADGSYFVVVLVLGLLSGVLAWRFARRSGPWTVVALAVGGTLAALIAARVGLIPGSKDAVEALRGTSGKDGTFELFLGARNQKTGDQSLRGAWAAVGWPVGALSAFLLFGLRSPEALD